MCYPHSPPVNRNVTSLHHGEYFDHRCFRAQCDCPINSQRERRRAGGGGGGELAVVVVAVVVVAGECTGGTIG